MRTGGREVDIRVSVIPMIHGEGLVLRLLDKGAMEFSLGKLGMEEDLHAKFQELIRLPHGIILVTGPTGSGKSTTLYSACWKSRATKPKIITTEDPVEYQLDGINQIQVHPKIGLTFATSLRSILRHDPDIILVGEIRDLETAENAIQASLTGHLVFSTLHTNDAAGAYTRLVDMGVEPFLVSSTVEAVMAQRLVRTLAAHCRNLRSRRRRVAVRFSPATNSPSGTPLYRPSAAASAGKSAIAAASACTNCCPHRRIRRTVARPRQQLGASSRAAVRKGMRTLPTTAGGKSSPGAPRSMKCCA